MQFVASACASEPAPLRQRVNRVLDPQAGRQTAMGDLDPIADRVHHISLKHSRTSLWRVRIQCFLPLSRMLTFLGGRADVSRSDQEILDKTGAGEGIRTLDPNLGKVSFDLH
jgi:hypothetical protein